MPLAGPTALHVYVSRHICEVASSTRWYVFLTEPQVRSALRGVFAELARLLHSPMAIYLPDSEFGPAQAGDLVSEGQPIEHVADWLQNR